MTMLRLAASGGALAAMLATAACGGGNTMITSTSGADGGPATGSGGGGTGGGTGGTWVEAAHPAMPQVVKLKGPVLKTPKVQAVIYSSEPKASDIDAFLQEMKTTTYWSETTSEYGVGPLTILPTIKRPEAPPTHLEDSDIQSDLSANLGGSSPAWGAVDPNAIYLFILPPKTIIDAFGNCCSDFDGYHEEAMVGAVSVAYAVVCSCGGKFDGPGVSDVQQVTIAASHELVEAATDPFPDNNPAYGQTDLADIAWTLASGGELADLCEFNRNSFLVPPGSKYMVQQSWSNAAAAAGDDPCVPVANKDPYFAAIAVMKDTFNISGIPGKTTGVKLMAGQSATVDVQLFSNGPTKPFKVTPHDISDLIGGSPNLAMSLDKNTGVNGDILKLSIQALQIDATLGVDVFFLSADLGTEGSLTMGAVGN
jgi:hypothetical protein